MERNVKRANVKHVLKKSNVKLAYYERTARQNETLILSNQSKKTTSVLDVIYKGLFLKCIKIEISYYTVSIFFTFINIVSFLEQSFNEISEFNN